MSGRSPWLRGPEPGGASSRQPGEISTRRAAELAGVTTRQLHYWRGHGILNAEQRHVGSGRLVSWTLDDVARAAVIDALVRVGFDCERAAAELEQLPPVALWPEVGSVSIRLSDRASIVVDLAACVPAPVEVLALAVSRGAQ